MRFSSSSVLILSACVFSCVDAQGLGSAPSFGGSAQPVGVATPPPVATPVPVPTDSPTEEPTITAEPTDVPTPTPTVSNEDVCEDLDEDWEDWYEVNTDGADHTCQCQYAVEGLPEDRIRMNCFGEELYCCAATGVCYETDDSTEHAILDREDDGVVDLSIWRSCTNIYQGGVENPIQTHRICHEFAYAPRNVAVERQTSDPPLAGCRVSINGQQCNSCSPCEQNGFGMTGYDCSNIPGVEDIPPEVLPAGIQTECHFMDFPECTFNGGFVDTEKPLNTGSGTTSMTAKFAFVVAATAAIF